MDEERKTENKFFCGSSLLVKECEIDNVSSELITPGFDPSFTAILFFLIGGWVYYLLFKLIKRIEKDKKSFEVKVEFADGSEYICYCQKKYYIYYRFKITRSKYEKKIYEIIDKAREIHEEKYRLQTENKLDRTDYLV